MLELFDPAGWLELNSRIVARLRLQFASEVGDELRQLVLSARQGGQLGSEIQDHTHESLVRDILRVNCLRCGRRGGRRHFEN